MRFSEFDEKIGVERMVLVVETKGRGKVRTEKLLDYASLYSR